MSENIPMPEDQYFGDWVACTNCQDGFTHHDCGEDSCCCIRPENNVICNICNGDGGWTPTASDVFGDEEI